MGDDFELDERYESPAADEALVASLRAVLASASDIHEAYLVTRRVQIRGGPEKVGLGFVAHVGGRWRAKKQIAALGEVLEPFLGFRYDEGVVVRSLPSAERAPLSWTSIGNSPVPNDVKQVGLRLR